MAKAEKQGTRAREAEAPAEPRAREDIVSRERLGRSLALPTHYSLLLWSAASDLENLP